MTPDFTRPAWMPVVATWSQGRRQLVVPVRRPPIQSLSGGEGRISVPLVIVTVTGKG